MTRVAYLVSDYDAPSHTFVRREVAALRALHTEVLAFTIHAAVGSHSEATSVLGRPISAYLIAPLLALFRQPLRFFSTWMLSLHHRAPGMRALIWTQFHFIEAIVLARLLSKDEADHLHVHFANSGATVGMLASHYLRLPWSLTLHGISETDYPAGLLLPDKISRASFVACASYFMQAQAMRHVSPEQWPKFRIVRCGVDYHGLDQYRKSTSDHETPNLICVGRLSPEKGHLDLLEVIAELCAQGVDCRLNLVGDGPSRAVIEKKVSALRLENKVCFSGFLSEGHTLEAIAESDVLVLPSFMEGLPVVLIEAMALGKPVIASRVAGIPELIEHGRSGYLFTPSDKKGLEKALIDVFQHRTRWAMMGRLGRDRVEEEFISSDIAKELQVHFHTKDTSLT